MLGTILVIDDDPLVLEALRQTFMDDYRVIAVSSGEEGVAAVKTDPTIDTVVLDIRMANLDGLATSRRIREHNPELPIIFHTGYPGDYSEGRVDAEHQPFDFVGKNERPERLVRAVKNSVRWSRLKSDSSRLCAFARQQFGMVGRSRVMRELYQTIEKIAPSDNKVMILGETGTGKELVARAIHKRSRRADRPWAVFNCNHKAPDLVESELFGHLRGSFTGAIADRMGLFLHADGGTLFLDEIGDLDMTTQAKLLRVIETGELQQIGSPQTRRVDVRIVCATNQNLEHLVAGNRFREDLYYRLKGVTIQLAPLRERREDIPYLIDYFVDNYIVRGGNGVKVFEPTARDLLVEYDWPGNVRQLLDTVQSLIDLSMSSFITGEEVESYLAYHSRVEPDYGGYHKRVREFKRTIIIQALARNGGNVSASARELSLDPSNLRKMLKDLDIDVS